MSKWCSGQGKVICVHLSPGDCPDRDLVSLMCEVKVVLNSLQFHLSSQSSVVENCHPLLSFKQRVTMASGD